MARAQTAQQDERGHQRNHLLAVVDRLADEPALATIDRFPVGGGPDRMLPPAALSGSTVLALQRTHGNTHVQRLIAQRDPKRGKKAVPEKAVLNSVEIEGEEVPLYALMSSRQSNFVQITNARGNQLAQTVRGLTRGWAAWGAEMGTVRAHGDEGAAALQAVKKESGKIGEKTTGRRGEYARTNIQAYTKAENAVKNALNDLKTKQGTIQKAMIDLDKAIYEFDATKTQREVTKLEKDKKEEEERLEKQREFIKDALDLTKSFLDPEKWVEMVADVAIFAGKQIVDATMTSSPELRKLEKQLTAAQSKLVKIQDKAHLAAIESAAKALEIARGEAQHAKEIVKQSLMSGQLETKTAVETLRESRSTSGAAAAVEKRGRVLRAALAARPLASDFLSTARPTTKALAQLKSDYRLVPSVVEHEYIQDVSVTIRGDPVASAEDVAAANLKQLAIIETWLKEAIKDAKADLAYLKKGAFREGYDQIPAMLETAVANR